MVRDSHYRAKLAHRARGLRDADLRVGGVEDAIDARIAQGHVVRVLELGCGYGTALLELRARYGARVELHGLNRAYDDGNAEILARNAADRHLLDAATDGARDLPSIVHGDIADGLPFADDYFDVVYSQVAWLYFGRKIDVLRETMRVLRSDGLAKIEADVVAFRRCGERHRVTVEVSRERHEHAVVPDLDEPCVFGRQSRP